MTPLARPTKQAALWMLFLGPFFFIVYNFCNWYTAQRIDVGVAAFAWEKHLPFMPWLILPYMSIDAFFAASVFLCHSKPELNQHVYRIIAAILMSAAGFLLFPLKFSFAVPEVDGFNGLLFKTLFSFDKPFNQAPSLHISLLMILWVKYAQHLTGIWRRLLHVWFALIAVSVVGVYQHHFIDIVTGFAAGVLCLYLFPDGGWQRSFGHANLRLAKKYGLLSALFVLIAVALQGLWWSFLWLAAALLLVALGYAGLGAFIFQKTAQGQHPWTVKWLLWPYRLGARVSAWFYNRKLDDFTMITPTLVLGGLRAPQAKTWDGVLDLTTEFTVKAHPNYLSLPVLDMTVPSPAVVRTALDWIAQQPKDAVICVHCALGLSRSATIVAAWLVYTKQAPNAREAFILLRQLRPVVWGNAHELLVDQFK